MLLSHIIVNVIRMATTQDNKYEVIHLIPATKEKLRIIKEKYNLSDMDEVVGFLLLKSGE